MRVCVDHARKTIQVWCTRSEREGERILDGLRRIEGYKTVVFVSGTQPLAELTGDILRHNLYSAVRAG